MTDWERVERLRAKGLDWNSIARDPKVEFTPPGGVAASGRVLKTLYLQRRSSSAGKRRRHRSEGGSRGPDRGLLDRTPKLFLIGMILLVGGLVWTGITLAYPNTLGLVVPVVPYLLVLDFVGAGVLGAFWVRGGSVPRPSWTKPIVAGVVVGLALSGFSGLLAGLAGVPSLTTATTAEPGGFVKANNHLWTSSSAPVFFFMGSTACPFCSASSWAFRDALQAFGSLSGWTYSSSNPNDVDPYTPEVDLSQATLQGTHIALDIQEGNDNTTITLPPLSITERAYAQTYDPHYNIPFVVIGGVFIHTPTFVDPNLLRNSGGGALTPSQVETAISSGTGAVYNAIHAATINLEAFLEKADLLAGITPPSAVSSDGEVQAVLAQIT